MKLLKLNQRGSIALITVLIISAILLILVLGASSNQVSTSYQQLNTSSNRYSYYISEACLEDILGRLKVNINYPGGTITLGDGAICTTTVSGTDTKTIGITTVYMNYTNSYQAQISVTTDGEANNIRRLNWQKI